MHCRTSASTTVCGDTPKGEEVLGARTERRTAHQIQSIEPVLGPHFRPLQQHLCPDVQSPRSQTILGLHIIDLTNTACISIHLGDIIKGQLFRTRNGQTESKRPKEMKKGCTGLEKHSSLLPKTAPQPCSGCTWYCSPASFTSMELEYQTRAVYRRGTFWNNAPSFSNS